MSISAHIGCLNKAFKECLIFCLLVLSCVSSFAETETETQVPQDPQEVKRQNINQLREQAKNTLVNKLKNKDGNWLDVQTLPPIDFVGMKDLSPVSSVVEDFLKVFAPELKVKLADYKLKSVSLEKLRIAMAVTRADILVVSVVLPNSIDMYLYDKRTPHQVYAQSEGFAEGTQFNLSVPMAEHYARLSMRRTLYRYISEQFYDLPRDDSPPILKRKIPRVIASYQAVEMINREANSNLYASINWGSALTQGVTGKLWNSNLISLELGYNFYDNWFVEAAADICAYNFAVGSLKYSFHDREKAFRFMTGVGLGVLSNRHTFDWDQSNDITGRKYYVVSSISVLFPISDVYLKLESRAYLGLDGVSRVYTIVPGLHIFF